MRASIIAPVKIVMLFNPVSGSGRAAAAGRALAQRLTAAGHQVEIAHTRLDRAPREWLDGLLVGAGLLVVAGGDGAVRLAAASAVRCNTPLYHLPLGTENLFAREFGMDRRDQTLLAAIERYEVRKVDLGIANGRAFLLMASVGLDAEVVHDLAARRGASISQFSYLPPIFRQLRRWRPPVLEISIDREIINESGPGFVVVANCKQYGWRLNPGGRASMSDGLLDVAFFPTRSRRELIGWALRSRLQRHFDDPRLVYRTGRSVTVSSARPQHYQLDGDPPGIVREVAPGELDDFGAGQPLSLEITVQPGVVPVLMPARQSRKSELQVGS
jgi:diacylglycerol kinase family enzyme